MHGHSFSYFLCLPCCGRWMVSEPFQVEVWRKLCYSPVLGYLQGGPPMNSGSRSCPLLSALFRLGWWAFPELWGGSWEPGSQEEKSCLAYSYTLSGILTRQQADHLHANDKPLWRTHCAPSVLGTNVQSLMRLTSIWLPWGSWSTRGDGFN